MIIEKKVNKIESSGAFKDINKITFEEFFSFFKKQKFSKIAPDLGEDEKYVRGYFDHFVDPDSKELTRPNFIQLYGLLFLETQLLIVGIHPTLSYKYLNRDNFKPSKNIDLVFYAFQGTSLMTDKIFKIYGLNDNSLVKKPLLYKIFENTHLYQYIKDTPGLIEKYHKYIDNSYDFFLEDESKDGLNKNEFKIFYFDFFEMELKAYDMIYVLQLFKF